MLYQSRSNMVKKELAVEFCSQSGKVGEMKFSNLSGLFVILASIGLGSCASPEWVDREQDGSAGNDEYRFDILTLSEWAGNIMPTKTDVRIHLYERDGKVYLFDSLRFQTDDKGRIVYQLADNSMIPVDIDELGERVSILPHELLDGIDCSLDKSNQLEFDKDACTESNISSEADVNCLAKKLGIDTIYTYQCDYFKSGSVNLISAWNLLKEENVVQIKVGNGDSFGVSQSPSAMFNDLPVPMMLNAVGFDVDTLGNHSFDRTLTYLQDVIDNSIIEEKSSTGEVNNLGYHYVASNLTNTSKNLNDVVSYELYKIPGNAEGEELKVALIGVLGAEIMSSVFPGRFGSVDINSDPCEISKTIERAYNNNARAFFIMAHALTDSDSLPYIFRAIYSFKNPQNYKSNSCPSVLEVPPERLEKVFGQRHLGMIDMNSENTKKYKDLILKIRSEIFDGIIGVIGEASSDSKFIELEREEFEEFNDKFAEYEELSKNSGSSSQESNESKKPKFKDMLNQNNLVKAANYQGYIWGKYTYKNDISNENDEHKIYFIQYPDTGGLTSRIQITAQKEKNPDWTSEKSAPKYTVGISQFDLVPVVQNKDKILLPDSSNVTMNYSEPKPLQCKAFFDKYSSISKDINGHSLGHCKEYYNTLKSKQSVPNSLSDLDVKTRELFDECYEELYELAKDSRIDIKKGNSGGEELVSYLAMSWLCLYNATAKGVCDESSIDEFKDVPVFEFEGYKATELQQNRSRSTYSTNIMTESLLSYINDCIKEGNYDESIDCALMNSGGLRDVPGGIGTLTKQIIAEAVPYDNAIRSCVFSDIRKLVSIIEGAFNSASANQDSDYGGFPALARLAVSYNKPDAGNDYGSVSELWLTDRFGLLLKPLYIRMNGEKASCETTRCVLGSYALVEEVNDNGDKKLKLEVKGLSPNYYFNEIDNSIFLENNYNNEFRYVKDGDDANNLKDDADEVEYIYNGEELYYMNSISLLTNDFLVSGGDGYNFNDPDIVCSDPSLKYRTIDSNVKLKAALYNYYNGNSKIKNVCSEDDENNQELFETVDGLSPDDMACVLSLNHIFMNNESQDRWIEECEDGVKVYCKPEKLKSLLEKLK